MLTFFGGPRACVGYQFALIEYAGLASLSCDHIRLTCPCRMKIFLHRLLSNFSVKLPVPADDVTQRISVVMRPVVKSELHKGVQMPILLTRIREAEY
jgi:hypothetical protein